MKNYLTHYAGAWRPALTGTTFETIDPFTGDVWATLPRCGADDVEAAVNAAHNAFCRGPWPAMTATERGRLLRRLGELVTRDAEKLAAIEVRDNGKLITEMRGQMSYSARWWDYFGGLADKTEGTVPSIDKPGFFVYTKREPLGVIAAITPWNSPLMLSTWKLAPALAAGNTIVWKPSEYTSASALEFMRLVEEAGFPPGVINVVTGFGDEVGAPLVSHRHVAKVAFTGGEATGQRVCEAAARALIPTVMELGGKSANIVFDDADLEEAMRGAVAGIFAASGQTCVAGSRLLVQRRIHDAFVDRLVSFAAEARLGNPMLADTQVGPVTTRAQHQKVLDYIAIGQQEGAELRLGGKVAEVAGSNSGLFVQPTIFSGVGNDMRVAREEIFGPVLSVIPFDDEADALRIANDSPYGLAGGVWTTDMRRALRMADGLAVGTVWINTYRAMSFMAPFGGRGRSGFGRENGAHAMDEYLQAKSVWIGTAPMANPFALR